MGEIVQIQIEQLSKCFGFWDFKNDVKKRKHIECDITSGKRSMFAYVQDEKYIAGMSLSVYDEDTYLISYLSVEKEHQSMGIGTKMMNFAWKYVKQQKKKRMFLEVDYENVKAKNFYKKMGFIENGIGHKGRVCMIKKLQGDENN